MTKKAVDRGSQLAIYNLSGIYSSIGKREGIMIKFVGFVAKAHA